VCAVVAGLITRAHRPEPEQGYATITSAAASLDEHQARTVLTALDEAEDELRDRVANCPDCCDDAPFCTTCESRLDGADSYAALAKQLGRHS
jgi:hypothetical protein